MFLIISKGASNEIFCFANFLHRTYLIRIQIVPFQIYLQFLKVELIEIKDFSKHPVKFQVFQIKKSRAFQVQVRICLAMMLKLNDWEMTWQLIGHNLRNKMKRKRTSKI